eukprot:scaffold101133_cov51-Attheya_sp.AAC.2
MAGETQEEKEGSSALVAALKETSSRVKGSLAKSIDQHVNNEKFDAGDGLDFLEAKNSLLLTYLIELTWNTRNRLTTSGKSSNNKNVERLQELKVALEKIRPLEKKMRYQIDKLLALERNSVGTSNDPLSFRPNPKALVGKDSTANDDNEKSNEVDDSDEEESDNDQEEDEEIKSARMAISQSRKGAKSSKNSNSEEKEDGVYMPPRLTAVPFTENEKVSDKKNRMEARHRERMRTSELAQVLRSQYGDGPEEDDLRGGAQIGQQRESARRFEERQNQKTKHEEDTMVRMPVSRQEKKDRNRIMRDETSNLNAIADLGNLVRGVGDAFGKRSSSTHDDDDNNDDDMFATGRHVNGKRKRNGDIPDDRKRQDTRGNKQGKGPKNSFQKALYGSGGGGKTSKKR